MKKINLTNILLVVLIVITVGLYFKSPIVRNTIQQLAGAVGDVNTTQRMLQQQFSLSSTTAFSSLNSNGDRIITEVDYYMGSTTAMNGTSNLGVATLNWTMSTSTDVYNALSANYVLNTTVATSTSPAYLASTTPGNATATTRVWTSGSYLNLVTNATSTTATPNYIVIKYLQL